MRPTDVSGELAPHLLEPRVIAEGLLFDWDPDQLNALSRPQQEELLETLEKMKKNGNMIMIEGQETVDLVLDEGGWKIFLDSGIKVTLKADSARSTELEPRFVQNELIVKRDEPFPINLKIKNRSNGRLWRGLFITLNRAT